MDLVASGATCIAYETVTSPHGGLPLLTPMSEVAGRLAPQVWRACAGEGAGRPRHSLGRRARGARGRGDRARRRRVRHPRRDDRARHGANVTVVDKSNEALRRLSAQFGTGVRTIYSTRATIAELVKRADLLIGAVLVPGAAAPKLVTRAMLATMKPAR